MAKKSKKDVIREECGITDNQITIRHNTTTIHHWNGEGRSNESFYEALYRAASEGLDWRDSAYYD